MGKPWPVVETLLPEYALKPGRGAWDMRSGARRGCSLSTEGQRRPARWRFLDEETPFETLRHLLEAKVVLDR
jgi:hypothetical protein